MALPRAALLGALRVPRGGGRGGAGRGCLADEARLRGSHVLVEGENGVQMDFGVLLEQRGGLPDRPRVAAMPMLLVHHDGGQAGGRAGGRGRRRGPGPGHGLEVLAGAAGARHRRRRVGS